MTTPKTTPQMNEQTFLDRYQADVDIRPTRYFSWKRIFDVSFSCLMLIPALPLMAVLCAIVRLTSKGPAIFRQRRVGHQGQFFTLYKLRSMRADAETASGPVWSTQGDPRVTWIGFWLRTLHLDELPQLFNVLKGEMALIGPRPERPEFVYVLMDQIPGYMNRLAVLPGITGLAQVNLPPDTDLDSVRRKQVLDVQYIETATHSMDLRLFFATFVRIPLKGYSAGKCDPHGLRGHAQCDDRPRPRFGTKTSWPLETALARVVRRFGSHRMSRYASWTSSRHRECSPRCPPKRFHGFVHR
jgi:lipopolysaccharide/colanic/teichoic acid biosynthesis glycosyltransferase